MDDSQAGLPPYIISPIPNVINNPAFSHLVKSNDYPLPAEEIAIRGVLDDLKLRVSQLDTFIASEARIMVHGKPKNLSQQRLHLLAAVKEFEQLVSSVRRLPTEILHHIFSLAIPYSVRCERNPNAVQDDSTTWWDFFPEENPLWSLECVCKRWHDVMNGRQSTFLWCRISIIISETNFSPPYHNRHLLRIAKQLNRSMGGPNLSVCLCRIDEKYSRAYCDELPEALVGMLLPFAARIEMLSLFVPCQSINSLAIMGPTLTSLVNLVVLATDHSEDDFDIEVLGFAECCTLRTVDILEYFDCDSTLPWRSLERFTTKHTTVSQVAFRDAFRVGPSDAIVMGNLGRAKLLKEADVQVNFSVGAEDILQNLWMETTPELLFFKLTTSPPSWGHQESAMANVLTYLTAPRLSDLYLRIMDPYPDEDEDTTNETLPALLGFIARSECSLTKLHLHDIDHAFHEGDINILVSVFHATPHLTELKIVTKYTLRYVIMALGTGEYRQCILPKLDTLRLTGNFEPRSAFCFIETCLEERIRSNWTVTPMRLLDLFWARRVVSKTDDQPTDAFDVLCHKLAPFTCDGLILITRIS